MKPYLIAAAFALNASAPAMAVELLVNGGFETGDTSGWFNPQHLAVGGLEAAHSGDHGLVMPFGEGALAQLVNTNIGDSYVLSFWASVPAIDPSRFRDIVVAVYDADFSAPGDFAYYIASDFDAFPYRQFVAITYVAGGRHTYVNLGTSNSGFGAAHAPADWYVDDISFTGPAFVSVPEPASWAMLIAGFGLVGTARRRTRVAT